MMGSASTLHLINGNGNAKLVLLTHHLSSSNSHSSSSIIKWGWNKEQETSPFSVRTKNEAIRVLANPNLSPSGKAKSKKEVIMVDPLEAKRLAKKQMEQIKATQRFKRRREIEAINGAWAMLGLTAGLVIEGNTGHTILHQLAAYLAALTAIFSR